MDEILLTTLPNPVLKILWDIRHKVLGEDHGAGDAGVEEHHEEEAEEADVPEGLAVAVLRTGKVRIQIRSLLEVSPGFWRFIVALEATSLRICGVTFPEAVLAGIKVLGIKVRHAEVDISSQ